MDETMKVVVDENDLEAEAMQRLMNEQLCELYLNSVLAAFCQYQRELSEMLANKDHYIALVGHSEARSTLRWLVKERNLSGVDQERIYQMFNLGAD